MRAYPHLRTSPQNFTHLCTYLIKGGGNRGEGRGRGEQGGGGGSHREQGGQGGTGGTRREGGMGGVASGTGEQGEGTCRIGNKDISMG